jgi:hypothetical protein
MSDGSCQGGDDPDFHLFLAGSRREKNQKEKDEKKKVPETAENGSHRSSSFNQEFESSTARQ